MANSTSGAGRGPECATGDGGVDASIVRTGGGCGAVISDVEIGAVILMGAFVAGGIGGETGTGVA